MTSYPPQHEWLEESGTEEHLQSAITNLQLHSTSFIQVKSFDHAATGAQQQQVNSTSNSLLMPLIHSYSTAADAELNPSTKVAPTSLPTLIVLACALILSWIFNNVSWVYLSDRAGETYAFAVDQITSLLLIAMQAPYVIWAVYSGHIPRSQVTALPLKVLLLMGTIDGIYDVLVTMGSPYTPGPFQTLLFQLPIPLTMLICFVVQKRRFGNAQYLGGLIILAGAAVSVGPGLLDSIEGKPQPNSNEGAQLKAASVLIYGVGVVFYSCNVVYKESALQHTGELAGEKARGFHCLRLAVRASVRFSFESFLWFCCCVSVINVWFFSVVVSSINFLVSFLLIPLLWIPGMGTDTPRTTFPHMWGGVRCIFEGVTTEDPSAECDGLWWITLLQVASNVAVNLLTLQLVRSGSALLLQVVSGVQLPLCNLVYAWTLIMGTSLVVPMTNYMVRQIAHTSSRHADRLLAVRAHLFSFRCSHVLISFLVSLQWIGLSLVTVGFFVYSFLNLGGSPSTRQVSPEPQLQPTKQQLQQSQQDSKPSRPSSAAITVTRTMSASSKGLQEESEQSYRPPVVL